jgi:signal transduction histidine kinase
MGSAFLMRALPEDSSNLRARKMVAAIQKSADRLSSLVQNFIDFTNLERGRCLLSRAEHELVAIIDAAADRVAGAAAERRVRIVKDTSGGEVRISCDKDRLVNAIVELLKNAVRYTPPGGDVRISAKVTGDRAIVEVEDHGPGISGPRREHLFEPYWHMQQRPRDGAGFGLGVAQGLAAAHGGTVRLASTSASGSTFELSIPCLVADET